MKKNLIWLLTIVMSITFGALLYFQIMYLENMVSMRRSQFSEGVMRSLYDTSEFLERQESIHYLASDVAAVSYGEVSPSDFNHYNKELTRIGFPSATQNVGDRYGKIQEILRTQYLYQRGMVNEVILNILQEAPSRPVIERADSTLIRHYLTDALKRNGVDLPFEFAISGGNHQTQYATPGFDRSAFDEAYSITLFPNLDNQYQLYVDFPSANNYIFSSVRFIIPTLALTIMLLVIFIFTIVLAFRQKKVTEIKTDFINNMTHELKTPVSTISLAAQMLGDQAVMKSPAMLNHLAEVIGDESKRLRFQIEKVLQMSVLENSESALNITDINVNQIVNSVVNTFKLKVEKFGGTLEMNLEAVDDQVKADEMQFTNVIFNLLDNAVKYRNEDIPLKLEIITRNKDAKHITIEVSDNGIGIRKDDLKRIFEKFFRVSTGNLHNVKGFGLGLAYVKKMVSIFGGTIHVESDFGKGTRFFITLPISSN